MQIFGTTEPGTGKAEVSIALDSPFTAKAATGLMTVFYEIRHNSKMPSAAEYKLIVTAGDSDVPSFTKDIKFTQEILSSWVAINTHRLANGPCTLVFSLEDANGGTVCKGEIRLQIANVGPLAESVKKSLDHFATPIVVEACDVSHYDYSDESLTPWFDRKNAFDHIQERLTNRDISEMEASQLQQFVLDGYIVLPGLLSEGELERINQEIDDAVAKKLEAYEYGSSQRLHQLHLQYPGIRELWRHPKILKLLGLIFESPARPCQSLTYLFGSQQYLHQDTIFLTPFPAGYMCGVWFSLEDVQPDSGELEFYKGSHRLPRVYLKDASLPKLGEGDWPKFEAIIPPLWQRMIDASNLERIVYRPKAGTALIWHENLMHGGSARINKSLSRRSIVTHNFADGAIAFYDSTGHIGHMEPIENLRAV
jgi:hypothetical protein